MSTTTAAKPSKAPHAEAQTLTRILDEGYGPGAWHGADFKAALADVSTDLAFWRPAKGRHNIAEIALHHAYCIRSVRGQISGVPPKPFVLDGEDWFDASDETTLSWEKIQAAVEAEQSALAALLGGLGTSDAKAALSDVERFNRVLGITCHAVYHAGQVQLIKRLRAA